MTDEKYAGYQSAADLDTWQKAYWYLRLLVANDRYGALGKTGKRVVNVQEDLLSAYSRVKKLDSSDVEKLAILKNVLHQSVLDGLKEESTQYARFTDLLERLEDFLLTPKDYFILAFTIKELVIPTNDAVERVPTKEAGNFAKKYARALLDEKGEAGLATLIREWDSLTEDLSLNKEREIIADLFTEIKKAFSSHPLTDEGISEEHLVYVLTAACQEYERRVGQKRKQRAGADLEGATDFIFEYFKMKRHGAPEHFTAGLEVDNWLKTDDGWYIGISLKRTLRERWKQTYTATEVMDRHRVAYIVHLISNDSGLGDSIISELGSYRHRFFIADDSAVLARYTDHVALGKYVFPMSDLIKWLKKPE